MSTDFCSIRQFAAAGVPLPVGGQYLLIEPGANPMLYVPRSETEDNKTGGGNEGGIGSVILGIISNLPIPSFPSFPNLPGFPSSETSESTTAEKPTEKPVSDNRETVRTPKPNGHCMKLIAYRMQILLSIF